MLRARVTALGTIAAVIGGMVIGAPAHADDDTSPPVVSINSPFENQQVPIGVQPLPTVQFSCEDDVAVETCDASIGPVSGANPLTVGNGMPLDLLMPGLYVLRVTSTDAAGNASESSVQFEMVGGEQNDDTAPTIQIAAPVDGAQVKKGAALAATYLCQDPGSGIEACEGTVANGANIDTTTLGLKEFTVVARDKAGNESTQTVEYEVIAPASVTVSGTIKDTSGTLLPGSTVKAMLAGTNEVVVATEANAEGVYSLTLPEGTYDLKYRGPDGSGIGANLKNRDLTQNRAIDVVLGPVGVTVSGQVTDGLGGTIEYANVQILDTQGNSVFNTNLPSSGELSVELSPGSYRFYVTGTTGNGSFNFLTNPRDITEDTRLDLSPQVQPVLIHLIGADGQPATGQAQLNCDYDPPIGSDYSYQYTYFKTTGTGELTVHGTPMNNERTCGLTINPDDGPILTRRITIPTTGTEITIEIQPGVTVSGQVTDGLGGTIEYANVQILDTQGNSVFNTNLPSSGELSVELSPGSYRFYVTGTTGNGSFNFLTNPRDITEDTRLDLSPQVQPVLIHLIGADGQPATGQAQLNCDYDPPIGSDYSYQYTYFKTTGTGELTVHGTPMNNERTCGLTINPDDGPILTRRITIPTTGTEITIEIQPGVTVSGQVTDGLGGTIEYANVQILDTQGNSVFNTNLPSSGELSVELSPGSYRFYVTGTTGNGSFNFLTNPRDITEDTRLDLSPQVQPVLVHLIGADGQPATGQAQLNCDYDPPIGSDYSYQYTYFKTTGTGELTVHGTPMNNERTCGLTINPDDGPILTRRITIPTTGTEITVFTFGAGIVIDGDTDATNDGDNVADAVEALAPNNGDGNNDGTPDYEQQNVTSLPVNGGTLGGGANYVTVAAPAGTELSNVFTIDPSDTTKVETPPPPGVTLPEGLTNLVLKNLDAGTDQTISIYTTSTQDVTGYAKYDPNTKLWSLLPEDRVQIFDNRVDITLTDGGIGDDDGQANGRISDPGGIAIVRNLDSVAPVVTGSVTTQPNPNGWYAGDVTVRWSATDDEPSSGIKSEPADTVIDGEGTNLTAESVQVCDTAGNCSNGTIGGINIDRTRPEVSVTGIQEGQIYTLGAAPAVSCTATDALSGIDGSCQGEVTGGNSNGVGDFIYTATARDKAGNTRSTTVSYRVVYRFDGFLQPINDPKLIPGATRSVFKSGSTVPVKFQLKRSDGSLIDPIAAPEWLTPERGSATVAAINEGTWSEPESSGTQFVKTNDQWQYNWKTKGVAAGFTYRIGVKLDDGTKHYVVVASK